MKNLIFGISMACMAGIAWGQGSLTPPGAPAPSMKSLGELNEAVTNLEAIAKTVDARIDIETVPPGPSGYLHKITKPGSYYLSKNIEVSQGCPILIYSRNVTLDLNGFEISAHNERFVWNAILVVGGMDSTVIRNGSIRGFQSGIFSRSADTLIDSIRVASCSTNGIFLEKPGQVLNCRSDDNNGAGIWVAEGSLIRGCYADGNGTYGIKTAEDAVLIQCVANNNTLSGIQAGEGSLLKACTSNKNADTGIASGAQSLLINCTASENTGRGFWVGSGCALQNCTASQNIGNSASSGFQLGQNCKISDSTAQYNRGSGILSDTGGNISSCVIQGNQGSFGIDAGWGSLLRDCNVSENSATTAGINAHEGCLLLRSISAGNTGKGIMVANGSTIKNCSSTGNGSSGISAYWGSRIVENKSYNNNGYGIYITGGDNRIDGNHVQNNANGIMVTTSGNFIIRNSSSGQTLNYSISGIQTIGGIYSPGSLTFYPMSPWENFSFK